MGKYGLSSFIFAFAAFFLLAGCAGHNTAINYIKDPGTISHTSAETTRALVVYDSWSGNTESVAQVIAGEMKCTAIPVDDACTYVLKDYDLIVVGSPVHGGMPTGKIRDFLSSLEAPRTSAVFVTYGAPFFGPAVADICLNSMEKKLRGTSIGTFKCHGFHHIFRTYPEHPDQKDKTDAVEFARGLMVLCSEH